MVQGRTNQNTGKPVGLSIPVQTTPSVLPSVVAQPQPIVTASLNKYLQVNYFGKDSPIPLKKYILFLNEDVVISESQTANYVSYSPLSRGSELFSYTGTKSRIFSINFGYSIKGITPLLNGVKNILQKNYTNAKSPSDLFFKNLAESDALKSRPYGFAKYKTQPTDAEIFIDNQIQIIRSLTINNAQVPTQGPPLVRLNFGVLYQDIPCICTDFDIMPIKDATTTLDSKTAFPVSQTIQIKMTLKEIRTGDYLKSDFAQAVDSLQRDNLVGWEQLFNPNTGSFDPVSPVYK